MDYITFPWEQLGWMLRRLSLSGSVGDKIAWILFIIIGAFPLIVLILKLYRHRFCRADFLLPILAISLYAGLWFFVNPSYIDRYLSPMPVGGFGKYALACGIDSLLLAWILLRFLSHMEKEHSSAHGRLLLGLRILLLLYALVLAAGLLAQGWDEFRDALAALEEGNSGSDVFLVNLSALFLALQAVVGLLPGGAQITLLLILALFLRDYEREAFGDKSCRRMELLKTASGRLLMLTLLANAGFNVLQLFCSRYLLTSSHKIFLPLREIIVLLGIRILSFLYLESKRLKEDNDMII